MVLCMSQTPQSQTPCLLKVVLKGSSHWTRGHYFIYLFINFYLFLFIYLKKYLFLAVLGVHHCAQVFSHCGEQKLHSSYSVWPSPAMTSLVAIREGSVAHGLLQLPLIVSRVQVQQLWYSGFFACSMWGLPRPGIKPVSFAL